MKKKSIRIRLTFYIVLLLTCVCILLTALSIYNANQSFVVPFLFEETETDSREERASVDTGESYVYMLPEETSSQAEEGSIVITQARRDFNIYSIGIMAAVIALVSVGSGICQISFFSKSFAEGIAQVRFVFNNQQFHTYFSPIHYRTGSDMYYII